MSPVPGWQRVEGASVLIACLMLAMALDPGWPLWVWPVIFLAPDLALLGYLMNPVAGAVAYRITHLYGFGLAVSAYGAAGWDSDAATPWLVAAGLVVTARAGLDRAGLERVVAARMARKA